MKGITKMLTDKIVIRPGDKVDFFYPLHGKYLPHGEHHVTVETVYPTGVFVGKDASRDNHYRAFKIRKVVNLTKRILS